MIKPSYERIKFLQNQLRTAIQNHHVLLLKSRVFPEDNEIKSQMQILQSLIISLGRTQNDLLEQLHHELAKGLVSPVEAQQHLAQPIPKNVPVFTGSIIARNPNPKQYPSKVRLPEQSETNPTPEIYLWKNKKLQSVLKPKAVMPIAAIPPSEDPSSPSLNEGFVKLNSQEGTIRIQGAKESEALPPKRRKTVDENTPAADVKTEKTPTENKLPVKVAPKRVFEASKTYTRSKRRQAVAAAKAAALAASKCKLDMDIDALEEKLKNEPIDLDLLEDDSICWNAYETMGKFKFFEHFNLISVGQRDAITIKKAGRKRRTVAGQSSFYSDYLQPNLMSMKGRLKDISPPATPVVIGRGGSRVAREGVRRAVAAARCDDSDRSSPSPSSQSSLAACVVATMEEAEAEAREMAAMEAEEAGVSAADDEPASAIVVDASPHDDQEDEDKLCVVCRTAGCTESCGWCLEKYHVGCADREAGCPSCQRGAVSDVKAIVGEGETAVPSSTLELIERYLAQPLN